MLNRSVSCILPKTMPLYLPIGKVEEKDEDEILIPATVIVGNIATEIMVTIASKNLRDSFILKSPLVFKSDIDISLPFKGDQVCLIRSGQTSKFRIDYTNDTKECLNSLKGCPYTLKIVACRVGDKSIEKQYHALYKEKEYLEGWFNFNDKDIKSIIQSFIKSHFSIEKDPIFSGYSIISEEDHIEKTGTSLVFGSNDQKIKCVCFTSDKIITGSDKILRVWDLVTKTSFRFLGHTKTINYAIALDENRICSCSDDFTLRIWNLKTKNCDMVCIGHESYVTRLSLFDQPKIISSSHDKSIRVWNFLGQCEAILTGHQNNVRCISPYGGNQIISGSYDNTVKIWDLEGEIATYTGHTDSISCMCIIGDTIISGSYDTTMRVWNLGKCTKILLGHKFVITCIIAYGDNKIISGSYDGNIRIWNLEDGKCDVIPVENCDDRLTCLFLLDNKVYAGTYTGIVKVYDLEILQCERTLRGHVSPILNINCIGGKIVTTSTGSTIRIWD